MANASIMAFPKCEVAVGPCMKCCSGAMTRRRVDCEKPSRAKALAALYFFGYRIRRRAGFPARRPLRVLPSAVVLNRGLGAGKYLNKMGFDKGRRGDRGGRGRDKRDFIGEDSPGQERAVTAAAATASAVAAAAVVAARLWRRRRRLRRHGGGGFRRSRRRRWRLRRLSAGRWRWRNAPQVAGEVGHVKFFNAHKGFGFIAAMMA